MTSTAFTDLSLRDQCRGKGVFRTAFDRIVDARQRSAHRYVARTLHCMNDDQLAAIGLDRDSLFESTGLSRR